MEKMNKKKGSRTKDLPPELLTDNILPRLPVKTILRFRLVCKLWCSAIDDHRFVSDHFTLSKNNVDKNQLLAIEKLGHGGSRGRRLTVRRSDTLWRRSLLFQTAEAYHFQVSCNGLFLVQQSNIYHGLGLKSTTRDLKLWNPSIRKSMSIPTCPLVARNAIVKYLFGFRPSSNDYVVYAFCVDENRPMKVSVAVYTLSDNLWRIRNYKLSLPSWLLQPGRCLMCGDESVFLDGVLHWFGSDPDLDNHNRPRKTHLVSFDFDSEKFSYREVPDSSQALETYTFRFLFVLDKSLSIFSMSSVTNSIWVLKNELWDLWFSGISSSIGFKYFCDHPDVVTKLFYVEDDGITLVYGKVAYKIMSDEIKELTKSLSPHLILEHYLKSMVLHKGCQGQILTSLKTPGKTTNR